LWHQIELHVQAMAYSDVFLIAAILTAGCIVLAAMLRAPRPVAATVSVTAPVSGPASAPAAGTVAGATTAVEADHIETEPAILVQVLVENADGQQPAVTWTKLPPTEFTPEPGYAEDRTPHSSRTG
jgi:hypothetical protein